MDVRRFFQQQQLYVFVCRRCALRRDLRVAAFHSRLDSAGVLLVHRELGRSDYEPI